MNFHNPKQEKTKETIYKKMRKSLLTLLLMLPMSLLAQVTGTIKGTIIDDENGEP